MESQPSLDANVAFRSGRNTNEPIGADIISKELDEFNDRYQYLIDELYKRLQEIAARNPNDIVTLVSHKKNQLLFICFFCKFIRNRFDICKLLFFKY